MYIEEYWGNYIGGTDDALSLVDYLAQKNKNMLELSEIFTDLGLNQLNGNFTETPELSFPYYDDFGVDDGFGADIYCAIDVITDLAGLLLECKKNGCVYLKDLGASHVAPNFAVHIIPSPKEYELLIKTVKDFSAAPLTYDLSELVPEEGMKEMAEICGRILRELVED